MYTISKTFTFCYGHRLVGDAGKCRHLHGHTGKATIVLEGERLDDHGMVVHFDELKATVGQWIEREIDHVMLMSEHDPLLSVLQEAGERVFPLPCNPTAENIARLLFEKAKSLHFPVVRVELSESESAKAVYAAS